MRLKMERLWPKLVGVVPLLSTGCHAKKYWMAFRKPAHQHFHPPVVEGLISYICTYPMPIHYNILDSWGKLNAYEGKH